MRPLLVLLLAVLAAPAFSQVGVLWEVTTGDNIRVVRVQPDGSSVVAGAGYSCAYPGHVARVAADGTILQTTLLSTCETIIDLVVAPDGAAYVLGTWYAGSSSTYNDVVLYRVEADGTVAWRHVYDGPTGGDSGSELDGAYALAVDALGYVTTLARSGNGSGTSGLTWTMRHAPDGTLLWSQFYSVTGFTGTTPSRAALDCAGNIYVSGQAYLGPKGRPGFVLSYAPDGSTRSVHTIPTAADSDVADSAVYLHGLDVACDGTATVSGMESVSRFSTQSQTRRAFVDRSGGSGASWQAFPFPTPSGMGQSDSFGVTGLAVGGPDAIYATAEYNQQDVRTARLRADGSAAWVVVSPGRIAYPAGAADASGVVVGMVSTSPYGNRYRKFGPDGTLLWEIVRTYGAGQSSANRVASLVMAPDGGAVWAETGGRLVHAGPAPAPAPTYAVAEPTAGSLLAAGSKVTVRWSGPGVPDRNDTADLFLRQNYGPLVPLATGVANTGKAKVTLPAGTPTGSGYTLVVARSADASVVGTSGVVGVTAADGQYAVTEPDAGEYWARGSTHEVRWTAPAGGPAGGTVTVALRRANGAVVVTAAGEPDDGAATLTVPAGLAATGGYTVSVTSDANATFAGASAAFSVSRFEVTAPAEGDVWTAGEAQTVAWTPGGVAGGTLKLSLRQLDGGFSQALATGVPYASGSRAVTVPAAAPAGAYVVQALFTYTPPGGTETRYTVNSNAFAVGTAPAPIVPTPTTLLAVRGLPDGAEVGVYAVLAGERVQLATGRVEAGEALVAVPSEAVVGTDDVFLGAAALTLRVDDDGAEADAVVQRVTRGSDGAPLGAVRLAEGDVLTVHVVAAAAATGEPAVTGFALTGLSPNPAASHATVRFASPTAAPATVVVYDLLGRAVATAFSGEAQAGLNEVTVQTAALPAGLYVVRVTAGGASASARLTVLR